ncbi:hypothetical protein [Nocardia sp. NPDC051463]|uniref:ATP-dependent DNA ligase n=1 Tax=Nocardia sp. NPDC051463 TaxID=3154845 RepID=UPI00344E0DE9
MLAVAGRPPDTAVWVIGMKWDGIRAVVVCGGGSCRVYSRNEREITGSCPELAAAPAESVRGRSLILDGEAIAQTASGAPSFGLLQHRLNGIRQTAQLTASVPVQFYGFDVLHIDDEDVTTLPYLTRRAYAAAWPVGERPARLAGSGRRSNARGRASQSQEPRRGDSPGMSGPLRIEGAAP